MPARLTEDRATIIANAIRNDNFQIGSAPWLEEHHVTRDEFEAFLEYPVRLAQMYDWRDSNLTVGSVEARLTFTSHSGKVGSDEEKWTVYAPQQDTTKILRVAETGPVVAQLYPEQMPLDLDGTFAVVNTETGELA